MLDAIPPRAYLITFRTYGTWLHGDERGSVDRFHKEFATPLLAARPRREAFERRLMRHDPVRLDTPRRRAVARAIRETCEIRGWTLLALNVADLREEFAAIVPCGLAGIGVTSLAEATGEQSAMADVEALVVDEFQRVFAVADPHASTEAPSA